MKIGYIRISTAEQNTARQEVLMRELEVDNVFIVRVSGKSTNRPELQKMMNFVREPFSEIGTEQKCGIYYRVV